MTTVTRRNVLKGGTALAGGMAGILASGRAPAFAQGTTVHWLRWNDFVPASDQLLRKELIPEGEKVLGIKINLETVNGNDLQPRITAGIQSGAGPDLVMLFNNHPQLYAASLVDMSDVAEAVGKADGKVVINSKETIESVKFMTGFWKEAHDEGGLAWDDTNNNRAFLSQTISATLNGASIYIESLRNPDKYITEKGAKLNTDILHAALPKGPAGQFSMHTYFSHSVPNYSKNQKAAKDLLKWVHSKPVYEKWFISQKGFATPPTAEWEKHKLWDEDPVMTPYKIAGRLARAPGYAGRSDSKAAEALSKYIIT